MKKAYLIGVICGLIFSLIGLFVGLQVSPALSTFLLFPFIFIGYVISQPLGEWPFALTLTISAFALVTWGMVFVILLSVWRKLSAKLPLPLSLKGVE